MLLGLAMGIATVFFIPSNIEPLFWIVVLGTSAYIIATRTTKRFQHGLLLGIANGVWVTGALLAGQLVRLRSATPAPT